MKGSMIALGACVFLALVAAAGAEGVAATGPSASAPGASPAVLLEKGIYTEQTVGDLDGAIGIYQRIVNDANANRPYVAQAQYRLGTCLLKKGQKDQALAAFRTVATQFADQKEVAALASRQLSELSTSSIATERLPWDVMAYIGQTSLESYAKAKVSGRHVNVHIYRVDDRLCSLQGGFLAYVNAANEPEAGPVHLGMFGRERPNFELVDEQGNTQSYELRERANEVGHWDLWWKPAQPIQPGGFRLLGYTGKKAMPLPTKDGKATLSMKNHFGGPVIESFFLVVPAGMMLENPSVPPMSKQTMAGLDVYLWQEDVPANTDHRVDVVLKSPQATSATSAPRVVKTIPAALATDVDPTLDKITVTFDRPMMDRSWSWTGGGDTYPKTLGDPSYDAVRTTCTLPVRLDPGKVYWVGVNALSYHNFKSAEGVPAPWYPILFATKSADGKPTPLPDDLVKQAKEINAASAGKSGSVDQDALKGKLIDWIGTFFNENYRDIKSAKTLEWGEPEKTAGGNLSIRYKYLATMRNDDKFVINQRFTFAPEGKYVSAETIEKEPAGEKK